MLARNEDINGAVSSMKQVEDRFNRNFNYPWVFLNDQPFSEEFMRLIVRSLPIISLCLLFHPSRTAKLTNAVVSYGIIPKSHWEPPEWIDPEKAEKGRDDLLRQGVVHGGKQGLGLFV